MTMFRRAALAAVGAACALGAGCASDARDDQLTGVAKAWNKTIRASQVIPIYPLQEDVRVGDLYVVQHPIEDEPQSWGAVGYLPLTKFVGRLHPKGMFATMYPDNGYDVRTTAPFPPQVWQREDEVDTPPAVTPAAPTAPAPRVPATAAAASDTGAAAAGPADSSTAPADPNRYEQFVPTRWTYAPRARFPAFSVTVRRDQGLTASFPIKSVPLGLGLVAAQEATASVDLGHGFSYELPAIELQRMAEAWATQPDPSPTSGNNGGGQANVVRTAALQHFAPRYIPGQRDPTDYRWQRHYLRVITKVFYVQRVSVTVTDTSRSMADINVGSDQSAKLAEMNKALRAAESGGGRHAAAAAGNGRQGRNGWRGHRVGGRSRRRRHGHARRSQAAHH